jgi:hypothetical protein
MKKWKCIGCETDYYSSKDTEPSPLIWTDGHKCILKEVEEVEE